MALSLDLFTLKSFSFQLKNHLSELAELYQSTKKKKKKIALFHFLRARYESVVDGGGNGNLLQYSCWENPMDRGAWQAIVYGVANSQTWLITWIDNIVSDWILKLNKYLYFVYLKNEFSGFFFFWLFLCFLFQKMINIIYICYSHSFIISHVFGPPRNLSLIL